MRRAAILVCLSLLFFAAFAFQTHSSAFLRVERGAGIARTVASRSHLPLATVMALHETQGGRLDLAALTVLAERFAFLAGELHSEPLAALALEHEDRAREALRAAGGDAWRALERLRAVPEGIAASRFVALVEGFRQRGY